MRIAASDPRWKISSLSAKLQEALSPPLDLSAKGAKTWMVDLRGQFLALPPGSAERKEFLAEMKKTFGYVAFLFKTRKALISYLNEEHKKLEQMIDTSGE